MNPKPRQYFEKFLELGSLALVAEYFGVSRQNIYQYLKNYEFYQPYKRNPPKAPKCPDCKSDRTKADGKTVAQPDRPSTQKFKCLNCNRHWQQERATKRRQPLERA